jgi:hypothetical protein
LRHVHSFRALSEGINQCSTHAPTHGGQMDELEARRLSEQYGQICQLRAQSASAMVSGFYDEAVKFSGETVRLSEEMLELLSRVSILESRTSHVALALAARSDFAAALAATGDTASAIRILSRPGHERITPFTSEIDMLIAGEIGTIPERTPSSGRVCLHGRHSFDGHCRSRPPCPL